MTKQSIRKIQNHATQAQACDEQFTKAIEALEQSQWKLCLSICEELMAQSFSIEQRLAVMCLQGLANGQSPKVVQEYLSTAYDYEQ